MSGVSTQVREYKSFRGVDFSTRPDEVAYFRSPDALNMWRNYKNDNQSGGIETRPDIEVIKEFDDKIYGIAFYDINGTKHRIVHAGTKLYDNEDVIYEQMAEHKSIFFIYDDILYFLDGSHYLQYDKTTVSEVVGYIPTTTTAKSPAGDGTIYQAVNILTDLRKNGFVADGSSREYILDVESIDEDYTPKAWINDVETTDFTWTPGENKITFRIAPSVPLTDGQPNVFIQFRKTTGNRSVLEKATLVTMFDTRIFLGGCPDTPNTIFHCSFTKDISSPCYFPDNCWYTDGLDQASIRGMVAGNNALWVFKEPNTEDTTIFYHNPVNNETYGKVYAPTPSSISTGCIGRAINFNDDIVFFSDRGMEGISSDVTTEQVIAHRSTLIDTKLTTLDGYKDMILQEWRGYLFVIIGNKMFLADSKSKSKVNTEVQYDWFYWELTEKDKELNIDGTIVSDEIFYLYSDKKLYTLTKTDTNIVSYWCTLADEIGAPQYQKTTNKRGCVADVEGKKITVYTKTDNNKFEKINTYTNVKGYIVPRIKKKKWKSLQLKFESNLPFVLYSCTLECYVGAYVKR